MRAPSRAVVVTAISLASAALLVLALPAQAEPRGARAAVAEFKRLNPCPATGKPQGACPGYRVGLVVPRWAEGEDQPGNMAWHPAAEVEDKRRWEQQYCQFHRQRARG